MFYDRRYNRMEFSKEGGGNQMRNNSESCIQGWIKKMHRM